MSDMKMPGAAASRELPASAALLIDVRKELMGDAMVLALGQLFELTLAIPLAVGAAADPRDALVVLEEPRVARGEALWLELVQHVLHLLGVLEVRRVVLGEVLEEGRAVREAHRKSSSQPPSSAARGSPPSPDPRGKRLEPW
eukprot:CAMPEP_0204604690 /NCGR_PEP_ID=MMETSP0661-20131031/58024_1 /ASSEMBLY_ACC=CAM_ASM_000606 /TAXON_ID=109239 /ORGANISM="Alexandrium margalefi, Strain AMGDE01CS-322" /LENGTH=141 /DNA_ID=CAMNT_0051615873 /DNA_START=62 /DNA_END=485 /DNA_ORIENTATION=-